MINYKLTIAALLLPLCAGAQQLRPFTLTGQVKGLKDGYVYLSYTTGGRSSHTDSALAKNGEFEFKGKLPQPVSGSVYMDRAADYATADICEVFLEPAVMHLQSDNGHFKGAKITGSHSQEEQEELNTSKAVWMEKLRPIYAAYNKGNNEYIAARKAKQPDAVLDSMKEQLTALKDQMGPIQEEMGKEDKKFIAAHPNSYVTANLLRFSIMMMSLKEGETAYQQMSPLLQKSYAGIDIKRTLDQLRKGSPGNPATPFSTTDINGQPIRLSDYKGKYVLLDFWASWCVPCRKGNPHLKELYATYQPKGLEIIGVASDDSSKDAWKKAVTQDGIGIWRQVLTGQEMDKVMKQLPNPKDIGENYGIQTLPTKVLIDPKGNIIGRYGADGSNDEEMNKKLKEIFGA
ncbi:TlpA disulfide reductase family protein [Chitinophaga sp.]|uniref:TlpA disulfide reductase family protein n=1 Tax=Chitinophaga sp. TaxID=1869181 RepID=UPI002F91F15A